MKLDELFDILEHVKSTQVETFTKRIRDADKREAAHKIVNEEIEAFVRSNCYCLKLY